MNMDFDESLLTAYLDDELTPEERALVEEHLAEHDEHRHTLRKLGELKARLAAVPLESFATDPVAAVRSRIEAERAGVHRGEGSPKTDKSISRPAARHRPGWHLWLPLGLAASGLAMLTLASLRQRDGVAVLESSSRITAEPLDDAAPAADVAAESAAPAAAEMASRPELSPLRSKASDDSDAPLRRSEPYFADGLQKSTGLQESNTQENNTQESNTQGTDGFDVAGDTRVARSMEGAGGMRGGEETRAAEAAGGMAGMGFARGAAMPQALPFAANPASAPLPAGTRLYRLSHVEARRRLQAIQEPSGQEPSGQEPSGQEPSGQGASQLELEPSSLPSFAAAQRVVFEVPPGEIEAILRWIDGGDAADSRSNAEPRFEQAGPGAQAAPVAVLIEAPPERLSGLLLSLEARIRQGQQASASQLAEAEPRGLARATLAPPAEVDTGASGERKLPDALDDLVIVLIPTEPPADTHRD